MVPGRSGPSKAVPPVPVVDKVLFSLTLCPLAHWSGSDPCAQATRAAVCEGSMVPPPGPGLGHPAALKPKKQLAGLWTPESLLVVSLPFA